MRIELLVAAYVLGGVTFLPLLLIVIFIYSAVALPRRHSYPKDACIPAENDAGSFEKDEELKRKLQNTDRESDVAAGYFAVCREYVAAGLNGKPPERKTPAGETIAAESPSVYQSMYRSIFDRNKSPNPTIESGKPVKRARNVFYIVLRHGHLVLFDNSDQLEVRHVISLAHYNVDIYGGGNTIPEGELYIKRNAIHLYRKSMPENATANLAPFYLFSDNCSDKEDFYHALLQSQRRISDSELALPVSEEFETEDMIKLIRLLHLSEDNVHMRWFNALLGRLFLALYKTREVESFVRNKISKKISRVQKPAFITSLTLKDISLGESAPVFNNMKLREMTVDGFVTLEADVKYSGKFRSVIAAVAKLELGQRFKPREVDLVLSAELRRVDGHMLIRIKPPPSNRIWVSFETMPKLEMTIEPIVSSRQITYGVIIRAIESRIREVFAETLVLPNWDDFPFTKTETKAYRGGIWKAAAPTVLQEPSMSTADVNDQDESEEQPEETEAQVITYLESPTATLPLQIPQSASAVTLAESEKISEESTSPQSPPEMLLRSNSFAAPAPASASPAAITRIPVMSNKVKKKSSNVQTDAASAMKILNSRSQDVSPLGTPTRLRPSPITRIQPARQASAPLLQQSNNLAEQEASDGLDVESPSAKVPNASGLKSDVQNDEGKESSDGLREQHVIEETMADRRVSLNQSLTSATAAAKKWGLGMMQRQKEASSDGTARAKSSTSITTAQPIGRGQPLPPPGEPLPLPADSRSWTSNAFGSLKRKPVPSPTSPASPNHQKTTSISSIGSLSSFLTSVAATEGERRNSTGAAVCAEPEQIEGTSSYEEQLKAEDESSDQRRSEMKMKTS